MLPFTIKSSFLIGKSCPALYSPINGSIASQSCGSLFGSQATLACNKGHRLSGSRVRSCQEDGVWSGRNTSCSSKIKRKRQGHPTTVFCKMIYSKTHIVPRFSDSLRAAKNFYMTHRSSQIQFSSPG